VAVLLEWLAVTLRQQPQACEILSHSGHGVNVRWHAATKHRNEVYSQKLNNRHAPGRGAVLGNEVSGWVGDGAGAERLAFLGADSRLPRPGRKVAQSVCCECRFFIPFSESASEGIHLMAATTHPKAAMSQVRA
jgi:hypothetical protein